MIKRAALAGVVLAIVASGPATAVDAEYDGFYGLVATTYGRGITLVEVLVDSKARVSTALLGLLPNTEYRLAFSEARCGHPATSDKNVGTTTFLTDSTGATFRAEVVPWLWFALAPVPRSVRLAPIDGGPRVCAKAAAFSRVQHTAGGDEHAEMEYSRFQDGARRGIVILDKLDGQTGRLSWTFRGLSPGHTYRLVGAPVGCAKEVTVGTRLYAVEFTANANGRINHSQDIAVENDETHWVGSNRVRRVGGGQWECRKASVTDLIIDPFNS